jgi:BirA family biotin operon repressor/biotin-[acetyl-CoA-carboxylase] ligase
MRLDVRWYPSVPSTMDVAGEAVQAGASEGLVILADEQTAGRGRRGRAWSSPPRAGLYFSMVLAPAHETSGDHRVLSLVTLTAGVAIRSGIQYATGLACELKWPNDVVLGRRKIAGILAEGHSIGTPQQSIVLGIGINVLDSSHPPDVVARATSLEGELGRSVDRAALFEEALVSMADWYDRLRRGEADDILRSWREASPSARGARVEWVDGHRSGITAGIDDTGALLVATETGIEQVIAGELRWI